MTDLPEIAAELISLRPQLSNREVNPLTGDEQWACQAYNKLK